MSRKCILTLIDFWRTIMKKNLALTLFLVVLFVALGMPASTRLTASQATPAATEAGTEAAAGFDPAICFRAAANNDKMVSFKAKTGPYKIGISNSFIGN